MTSPQRTIGNGYPTAIYSNVNCNILVVPAMERILELGGQPCAETDAHSNIAGRSQRRWCRADDADSRRRISAARPRGRPGPRPADGAARQRAAGWCARGRARCAAGPSGPAFDCAGRSGRPRRARTAGPVRRYKASRPHGAAFAKPRRLPAPRPAGRARLGQVPAESCARSGRASSLPGRPAWC